MLNIDPVPAFQDNYIWLIHAGPARVAVVDPGDAGPVLAALQEGALELEAILITHHHRDHTGGIADLVARHPVPVYGPAREAIPGRTVAVGEGDEILLGAGLRLRVIDTPGHTRGHVCYVADGALFCGDTLFTGGCGRIFEGTPEQFHASLEKLRALPGATQVYCAHEYTLDNLRFAALAEPDNEAIRARYRAVEASRRAGRATVPATLELERATNPFLRTYEPTLRAAAERFAGHPVPPGAELFATVRRWKDSLD